MRQRTLVYFEQELYQLGSLRSFSHLSLTSCTSGIYLNRNAAWLSDGGTIRPPTGQKATFCHSAATIIVTPGCWNLHLLGPFRPPVCASTSPAHLH